MGAPRSRTLELLCDGVALAEWAGAGCGPWLGGGWVSVAGRNESTRGHHLHARGSTGKRGMLVDS